MGLNPNDATVNQWVVNVNAAPKPVVDGTLPPGAIVMPGQPVNVNARALAGVIAQPRRSRPRSVCPLLRRCRNPHRKWLPVACDASKARKRRTCLWALPPSIQYGVVNLQVAAGEPNTTGPNQERLLTKAAGTEGNAQTAAAERVATAMFSSRRRLMSAHSTLTASLNVRYRTRPAGTSKNRQRIEDYEREAQAFAT